MGAYVNLNNYGFEHYDVNHSENFKDPVTGAHANTVEGNWRHLRTFIPRFGLYESYFYHHMWKKRFGKDLLGRFGVFLEHVSQIYDPTRAHDEIADVESPA